MNDGINELAAVAAYWLAHPWRAVGVYLLVVALSGILKGLLAAAFPHAKEKKG